MADKDLEAGRLKIRERAEAALSSLARRRAARRKFSVASGNSGRIAGMITQALPHRTVGHEALDREVMAFNVLNGTLRFERAVDEECPDPEQTRFTLQVRLDPHDPEDRISHLALMNYDPQATCPHWMEFLDKFQPNHNVRRFLQVHAGLYLTAMVEQVVVFQWGSGSNGKTTYLEALSQALGSYSDTLNPESIAGLNNRRGDQATPDFARLTGKRFVRIAELPRGESINESLIKRLAGGEVMKVRHLNKEFFDLHPVFKAVMSGNDKPEVRGGDNGIWRRIRLVLWPVALAENEKRVMAEVLAEFEQERAGILNWLIEGLSIYIQEGLVAPSEVSALTDEHRSEMDHVRQFLADCVEPDSADRVQVRAMYEAFTSWCMANAVKPWSETAFGRAMSTKGYVRAPGRSQNGNPVKFYEQLKLHDVPTRPDPPAGRQNSSGTPSSTGGEDR